MNQLQTAPQIDEYAAIFGDGDAARALVQRLMFTRPETPDVGERGIALLAQAAMLSGANPLAETGEIYIWNDNRSPNGFTVYLGIAYWRRKARENDGYFYVWQPDTKRREAPRAMNDDEATQYGATSAEAAAICTGYRLSEYTGLLQAGVPWLDAQMIAAATGIGIVQQQETVSRKGRPISPPRGRSWQWVAEKRAEIDLLRKLSLVTPPALALPGATVADEFFTDTGDSADSAESVDVDQINAELFGD